MQDRIEIGYQAFVSDGGEEFGAVRDERPREMRTQLLAGKTGGA